MLQLDSIWKSASHDPNDWILRDCSFEFECPGLYSIIGESGVGKTTLLYTINALSSIDKGAIVLNETDIASLHPAVLRRKVSILFQTPSFVGRTVEENLLYAAKYSNNGEMDFGKLLNQVQLGEGFLHRDVSKLSIGQKQRVCLARTLVTRPEILLLDEPTSALDDKTAEGILLMIRELSIEKGMLTIMVTHRREHAKRLSEQLLVLKNGQLDRMVK